MLKRKSLIVILLSLILLVACQAPNANPSSGSSSESNRGKKELTVWHIESQGGEPGLKDAVKRFEDKHPGVSVKLIKQENDPYKSKLVVAMGGGNPPDVFHSWGGGWLKNFVDAGQVRDITNDIDKDSYLEAALSESTFDGKVYGAPVGMNVVPVWYNKKIFKKYNIEEPKTYEELLKVIKTLKANDVIPFSLANKSKWTGAFYLMYFAERFGGPDLFNEAFRRTGRTFDDKAYIEAGRKIQELVKLGAFPEGMNGMNYDTGQSRQLIYTEKAAMEVMVSSYLGNVRKEFPEIEKDIGFFLFPAVTGGKGAKNHVVGGISPVFSVSEKSENADLAVELVKELSSKETAEKLANMKGTISAVKGVSYEDEYTEKLSKVLEDAEYLQTFYDQTLPPELAEVHLNTTQALFGLSITPEEAAAKVEEKAKEVLE
ncbi:extracellular solute-binding protein [Peribacillus sp. NPDC097895]|uniref:extracellular solute-binding protein n=1 Tax=Peribacillus sp. NPDC097895 TaxID=3390619 RepID=UPI003CFD3A67